MGRWLIPPDTDPRDKVEKIVMDDFDERKQEEEIMVSSEGESTGAR